MPDQPHPGDRPDRPQVFFVCVHNAGRSQMAAAFLTHLAGDRILVRPAGSAPAETVNPAVVQAMADAGIDISAEIPKVLTTGVVQASDVVITMGCGDACPVFPGKRYEDWQLDDSAGQGLDAVRPIRDQADQYGGTGESSGHLPGSDFGGQDPGHLPGPEHTAPGTGFGMDHGFAHHADLGPPPGIA